MHAAAGALPTCILEGQEIMWIAYMLTQGDETIVHSETGERRQLTDNAFAQDRPAWAKVNR